MDIFWEVLDGIFKAVGFGFLGFVVALVILFVMRAKGALKRQRTISKFLVITYWVFIPLISGAGFMVIKAITFAESKSIELSDTIIDEFEEQIYPAFHKHVTENIEEYTGETVIPTNEELVEKFSESTDIEMGWLSKKALIWFLEFAEEEAEKKIADETEVDQETIHAARLMGSGAIDGLFHGAFSKLKSVVGGYISKLYWPYYWLAALYWFLLIIFPIAENIIAWRRRKKLRAQEILDL